MKLPLVIIAGPTAVGKSKIAVELAKKINGEIISADSMQVYKHMNIGTAKVTSDEMQGIKHYLIDEFEPDEEFNVTIFSEKAKEYIKLIYEKGKIPILVGGTGFYIQAVLYDIDFSEYNDNNIDESTHVDKADSYREYLYKLLEEKGKDYLFDELVKVDPEYSRIIHKNNAKKVIRALEYFHLTGEKLSTHNKNESKKESVYDSIFFVINDDRDKIHERINRRVEKMINEGLVDEVKNLVNLGFSLKNISMLGIGYKEIIEYLEEKCSLEEAIEKIKSTSRQYARRQITWFKREKDAINLNLSDFDSLDKVIDYITDTIDKKI